MKRLAIHSTTGHTRAIPTTGLLFPYGSDGCRTYHTYHTVLRRDSRRGHRGLHPLIYPSAYEFDVRKRRGRCGRYGTAPNFFRSRAQSINDMNELWGCAHAPAPPYWPVSPARVAIPAWAQRRAP